MINILDMEKLRKFSITKLINRMERKKGNLDDETAVLNEKLHQEGKGRYVRWIKNIDTGKEEIVLKGRG